MKAEEIIIEIYRQKKERLSRGEKSRQVVMSMNHYRTIQDYHRRLGPLEGEMPDYITPDSLFGLEILIDNQQETIVC